jgi:hypothetical protein
MAQIISWDASGERKFETGVDHGVLYLLGAVSEEYDTGFAWNGLTAVTVNPSGAEPTPLYADNMKYLNLISAEEFGCTIEAFTYPDEFAACDGSLEDDTAVGVVLGNQPRKQFGLCYRTKIGNDTDPEAGYKLHLVYGCSASPSEKAYNTVNDSPEAITFSWEVATTPVVVAGYQPTSYITIDSTKANAGKLAALLVILYGVTGTPDTEPRLPFPDEIITLMTP